MDGQPEWYANLDEDEPFWTWWTTGTLPASAHQTLKNTMPHSRDTQVESLYIWWKMGGTELSREEVAIITKVWLRAAK